MWSRATPNFIALSLSRLIRQTPPFFFCSWILKDCIKVQGKKRKVVVLCSRPPYNVKFGIFTMYSRAVTAKKQQQQSISTTVDN